ncbi:MAG: ABC transporter permease [Treponemataceae bacterium]|nr:MAG: ABC transporter permease [Treponemataceae bacterium]
MRKYITQRLLTALVILFFVAFLIYLLMRALPTSYIEKLAAEKAQAPGAVRSYEDWVEQLGAVYGMNKGILAGFFTWLVNAFHGNFGDSWLFNMPVLQKFTEVIGDSIYLGATSTVLQFAIAIPIGMFAAHKQYSPWDYAITVIALIGISLPTFFLATILKLVFAVQLGWFDLYGKVGRDFLTLSAVNQVFDVMKHYVLPVATLTIINIGAVMRYTRTNMLEVLHSDYIRTARAKGLPESRVIFVHAFRNTLIPLVTMFGQTLPALFGGALITETLFQIPGVGYTSYLAMRQGDIPFAMFFLVFISFLTLLGTLLADILYAVVDPRVRVA